MDDNYKNFSTDNWSDCYKFAAEQIIKNNRTAEETKQMLVERGMNLIDAHNLVSKIENELKEDRESWTIKQDETASEEDYKQVLTPGCLKKWNMGAFVFPGLWGIFNRVWWPILVGVFLGLLSYIAKISESEFLSILLLISGLAMKIYIGIKGNQMSWEEYSTYKDYTTYQFDDKQRGWNTAGWILFGLWLCIVVIALFVEVFD